MDRNQRVNAAGRKCDPPELYVYDQKPYEWVPRATVYSCKTFFWDPFDPDVEALGHLEIEDVFLLLETTQSASGKAILKILTRFGLGMVYPKNNFKKIA